MKHPHRHSTIFVIAICLVMTVCVIISGGCRAIRRFGESRQAISARRLSGQGFQAMHDGRWDAAEDLFSEALNVSTADDRSHWGMAEAYWNRGQPGPAIEHMEKAVKLTAGDPKLVRRLGRMYLETGQLENAAKHSEWSLQSERDSADGWTLRGDVLKATGELENALAAYHRALAYQPDLPDVQLQAAEIYQAQHRFDRSLATLDQMTDSISQEDAPAQADMLRGLAMRNLGRPEEALRCFYRASQKDPNNPQAQLEIASTALQLGRPDDAQNALQLARALDPSETATQRTSDPLTLDPQTLDPRTLGQTGLAAEVEMQPRAAQTRVAVEPSPNSESF